ncbi:hypothetical protein VPH35_121123 [Triticum aestivum]
MAEVPPLTHAENREFLRILREARLRSGCGGAPGKVEVQFDDVSVHAGVPALPGVRAAKEILESAYLCGTQRTGIKILNTASGTIRSSRMTLVVGAPGSGKTTFLRALAGKLDPSLKFQGKVMYNGESISSTPHYMRAYVSQYDLHHAEMTVRETLNFSSNMMGSSNDFEMLQDEVRRTAPVDDELFSKATKFGEGSNLKTNYIMKILGLSNCADTIIGDELRRGISGGQKKRTTLGEMLVGRARCFFMDDISTGLDSSTTFEIMTFLGQMAHLMDLTMVISLLQPSPEILELFDDIILLCEGDIVYHGARQNVIDLFNNIGFTCPSRKNVADFLQESGDVSEYQNHTIENFVNCFKAYDLPQSLEDKQCKNYDIEQGKEEFQAYNNPGISKRNVFRACLSREVLLFKRNCPVHMFKAIQIIFLAFVIATLFLRTETSPDTVFEGVKYLGALFMGIAVINFNSMIELAMTTKRLPIFYKQRESLALPGWAVVCSVFLISLPISLMELFQQLLVFFVMHQMSLGLYRFLATIGRTPIVSNILGTQALVAIFILGGFIISKDDLQPWLSWGYWASPFTYALNALALNEYLDKRWAKEFHFENAKTIGEAILKVRGLLGEWQWYWICVVVLFGFALIFNILSILALEFLNSPHKHQSNIKSQGRQSLEYDGQVIVGGKASTDQASIPFQPLCFVFKKINYFVDMPKEMKKFGATETRLQLLRDVSGSFRPGVLTALMGITGAGKTTLLDVLAGRKTGGYIEGTINIGGYQKQQDTCSRITGYCEQTDIHSPHLTVYESLLFSAYLRLPSYVKPYQRDMFVEEIMELVELNSLRNAMVGIPGVTGLSAEQRKRLTIAVELVASPSIMFMDEPTTGLDARAAAIVLHTVRKLVDTGRTIVCTIHQPNIHLFESFDELLLMKQGGQLIYSGSLGSLSRNLTKYFEVIPAVPRIKDGQNPASWVLDISSHAMECTIGVDYVQIYENSNLYKENMALVDELSKPNTNQEDLQFTSKYWRDTKTQCMTCIWKQYCSYRKNSELNIFRFLNTFAISIMFGVVFWQIGSTIKVEQDVFNILGIGYGSALFLGSMNCNSLQPVVAMERVVFYREKASGMYSSMAFVIGQVAAEIPYIVIQPLIFSAIVYPMVGFQMTFEKFIWFVMYMILSFMDYTLYGMMAVALTPSPEIAAGLSFLIFMIWNFFSGFIITRKAMPMWWRWMYWADPAAWTLYGLVSSQLGDHTELIRVLGQPDQPVMKFLEEYLGLENGYFPLVTALHFVLSMFFCFIFCVGIKYIKFQKR